MRDEGQRLQSHCIQPHYQALNNSRSRHDRPKCYCMGVESGNSLTALYHEHWPMTCRKPGTIFVPTVFNPFFPFFLFPSIVITVGGAEPAAPCPHKAGTAPRLGAEGRHEPLRAFAGQPGRRGTTASRRTETPSSKPRRKPPAAQM